MKKVEFEKEYERFKHARRRSNTFAAIFLSSLIIGTGLLVVFNPKPLWGAIIIAVMCVIVYPSMFQFFDKGWEYEFIRRRLLQHLKEDKELQQELQLYNN